MRVKKLKNSLEITNYYIPLQSQRRDGREVRQPVATRYHAGSTPASSSKGNGCQDSCAGTETGGQLMGSIEPWITCYPVRPKKIGSFPLQGGVEQLVARRAHIPKVDGSSPSPASKLPCRATAPALGPRNTFNWLISGLQRIYKQILVRRAWAVGAA